MAIYGSGSSRENAWIGGGAIVLPGVSIGRDSMFGLEV
nr:hypothetical protein [Faecalibaculum rodentium]